MNSKIGDQSIMVVVQEENLTNHHCMRHCRCYKLALEPRESTTGPSTPPLPPPKNLLSKSSHAPPLQRQLITQDEAYLGSLLVASAKNLLITIFVAVQGNMP